MPDKFPVPKFITIEDKLAGLVTFKQLFALLGAFLLTFFVFKSNQLIGLIVGVISFGTAFLLTFVYVNGKPFISILPNFFDFLRNRKFVWQKIAKVKYEEIVLPKELETEVKFPEITTREKKILPEKEEAKLEIAYPEVAPDFKEEITISLSAPISGQTEKINRFFHRHLTNPKNPYRLFPYIKFYRTLK
ncbi:MAG: hypothetical protein KatS3mg093_102 [Candidatus Parcubacteria bacterium]|nr:MAG: hypothetical protein KatS3mg093_102 [Candidatus Parcubacteria bacterium]